MSDDEKARKREEFRAKMRALYESLPEERKRKLREASAFMTPERRKVFDQHLELFLQRAQAVTHQRELSQYISAAPDARKAIGQKIRETRKQAGMRTQRELAEEADVNVETISRIENGANVEVDTLAKVYGALFISMESPAVALLDEDREWFTRTLDALMRPPSDIDDLIDPGDVQNYQREDIPIIQEGEASPAGLIWDAEEPRASEAPKTSRPYDYRENGAYAIVLRGDSMEPLLKRGMRLIVSQIQPIGDGDLVYAQLRTGERLAKIATRQQGGWLLTSANPAHPPRFVNNDEIEHIHKVAYVRFLK